ncbi:Probable regulatory protein N [Pantoea ananatis]|nr:Probable regulatory protein N [Pantoea ananatis]
MFFRPKILACHPIAKDSFTGGVMAIIHYGKSVFIGNARTRRHQRRQPLNRLKQSIDDALNYPPEPRPLRRAEQICQRQVTSVVDRAVSAPQRRSKEISGFDNCCLPHVHLYAVR